MNRIEAMSPAKRTLLISVVLLSLVFTLVAIAEVGVRTRMYFKYGTFWGLEVKVHDDETGLQLPKPNAVVGPLRINSLGFRSPELTTPKPDDTIRLAFLGGSTTFCAEVSSNEMVWANIITTQLQKDYPQQNFDHINASATAMVVSESLINLKKRVAKHSPDIVFIYHSVNDIAVNSMKAAVAEGHVPPRSEVSPWFTKLMKVSLLADLVYKNLMIINQDKQGIAEEKTPKIPFDESMTTQFRIDLTELVNEALSGSKLVVIPTFSSRLKRDQDPEYQKEIANILSFHMPFLDIEGFLDAFDSYNAVIREFASMENVLVIETESIIDGTADNFADAVHFTDTGSTILGQHLATELANSAQFQSLQIKN